jgi:hypothetical protein
MWTCHAPKRCLAAVLLFVGIPGGAFASPPVQSEQRPVRDAAPRLVLGEPTRAGKDQVLVPVHFSLAEGERVGQIRAEIIIPEGPWRFRKVEVSKGSSLKSSAKQHREERTDSQGNKHRVGVIILSLSAGRNAISNGQIAQLYFSLERADSPISVPLAIRSFQTIPPEPETARDEPILEPPPADPPMNPATTCFFFAH